MKGLWMIYAFLLTFAANKVHQQPCGLVINEKTDYEYQSLPLAVNPIATLPINKSLKKYCPDPVTQGEQMISVPASIAYGAMTIVTAQQNKWENYDTKGKRKINQSALSPHYIYSGISMNQECNMPITFSQVFNYLQENGACTHLEYQRSPKKMTGCRLSEPDSNLIKSANLGRRIMDLNRVFSLKSTDEDKVRAVKQSLLNNHPVIVGMQDMKANFQKLDWDNPVWYPNEGDATVIGNHALLVIGYDDTQDEHGAFEVLNSFGTSWGNGGYAWIRYEDFPAYCRYAYQMQVPERDKFVNTEFAFRYYDWGKRKYRNYRLPFNLEEKYYEFKGQKWSQDLRYKILAKDLRQENYIYVFTKNAKGCKIYVDGFYALSEGQDKLLPDLDANNYNSILKKPGVNYACILYAYREIKNFEKKVQEIETCASPFMVCLQRAFREDLVPFQQIEYDIARPICSANPENGYVIPVVFKIE